MIVSVLRSLSPAFILLATLGVSAPEPLYNWGSPDGYCSTVATVVPWDATRNGAADTSLSDHFFVNFWTTAKQRVEARVLLFSKTDVYSVDLTLADLHEESPTSKARYTTPVEIVFDHPVELLYNVVDAESVDGTPMGSCPSYVEAVPSYSSQPKRKPVYDENTAPNHASLPDLMENYHGTPVSPTFVRALDVPCDRMYTGPHLVEGGTVVGRYGDKERRTLVTVLIDSAGRVVDTRLLESSGIDDLDQAAIGAAQAAVFQRAWFLCAPVVSTYYLYVYYLPNG